jgi:hypothetical protein
MGKQTKHYANTNNNEWPIKQTLRHWVIANKQSTTEWFGTDFSWVALDRFKGGEIIYLSVGAISVNMGNICPESPANLSDGFHCHGSKAHTLPWPFTLNFCHTLYTVWCVIWGWRLNRNQASGWYISHLPTPLSCVLSYLCQFFEKNQSSYRFGKRRILRVNLA